MSDYEKYKINDIIDETPDTKTFVFDGKVDARPGQFVMAWLPGVSSNPFSISNDDPFQLTIKKVKRTEDDHPFSWKAFDLEPGDDMFLSEPRGNSFLDFYKNGFEYYLVAGGAGAIPLAFMAEKMKKKPNVMLGAETREKIIFEERFKKNSKGIWVSTDDGSYGHKGQITDLMDKQIFVYKPQYFICGPMEMLPKMGEILSEHMNPENIVYSLEGYMKCSEGYCGSCEKHGYSVCKDGPVFSYDMIKDGLDYKRSKSGKK